MARSAWTVSVARWTSQLAEREALGSLSRDTEGGVGRKRRDCPNGRHGADGRTMFHSDSRRRGSIAGTSIRGRERSADGRASPPRQRQGANGRRSTDADGFYWSAGVPASISTASTATVPSWPPAPCLSAHRRCRALAGRICGRCSSQSQARTAGRADRPVSAVRPRDHRHQPGSGRAGGAVPDR